MPLRSPSLRCLAHAPPTHRCCGPPLPPPPPFLQVRVFSSPQKSRCVPWFVLTLWRGRRRSRSDRRLGEGPCSPAGRALPGDRGDRGMGASGRGGRCLSPCCSELGCASCPTARFTPERAACPWWSSSECRGPALSLPTPGSRRCGACPCPRGSSGSSSFSARFPPRAFRGGSLHSGPRSAGSRGRGAQIRPLALCARVSWVQSGPPRHTRVVRGSQGPRD